MGSLAEEDTRVLTTSSPTTEDLHRLFVDQTLLAIVIPNFVAEETCKRISSSVLEARHLHQQYTHDEGNQTVYLGVDRIGTPYNSTYPPGDDPSDRPGLKQYYEAVEATKSWFAKAAAPDDHPMQRAVALVDSLWPQGAGPAAFDEKDGLDPMLVGIGRVMQAQLSAGSEKVHIDCVPKIVAGELEKQFAANLYLQIPKEGGELVIWEQGPYFQEDNEGPKGEELASRLQSLQVQWLKDRGYSTEGLPEEGDFRGTPFVQIRPGLGDLVLSNTRRPHAVSRFDDTVRISIQSFIGQNGSGPLQFWN